MFCWASIVYTNSLPIRRAGSPVQVSAGPSTANLTPAVCSRVAIALVVLRARSSSAPAQPTQNRDSGSSGVFPPPTGAPQSRSEIPSPPPSPPPPPPPLPAHAPRVALVLQVFQHPGGLDGEGRLDQHLVAAHVVDVVDVLDVDRALVHAGAAVGTGPDHVRVDHAVRIGGTDQR